MAVTSVHDKNMMFSSTSSEIGTLDNESFSLRWDPSVGLEIDGIQKYSSKLETNQKCGDFQNSTGQKEKQALESRLQKVVLPLEKRILLSHHEMTAFESYVSKYRSINLYAGAKVSDEPSTAKGKSKDAAPKVSSNSNRFKALGLAKVDCSCLLYPGVSRLEGTFKLSDPEINEARTSEISNLGASTSFADLSAISEGCMTVNIEMLRPVVPTHDKDFVIKSISELIPERTTWPRVERGASQAVSFLKKEIKKTAEFALAEIRQRLGDVSKIPISEREQARSKLFYDLTISPEYQQYREELKYAIIRIVREKFLKTVDFESNAEKVKFLSNLSIYLQEVDSFEKKTRFLIEGRF